jgi:translation elongation factor P/translation initiation factor 5A
MNNPEDKITFGKYNGKTFYEISYIDPDYIVWLNESVKTIKLPKKFVDEIQTYIKEENSEMHDILAEYWYQ